MVMSFRVAGPQNPIYGIDHENITEHLNRLNWQTKAVVRCDGRDWLYLWIERGRYQDESGRKQHAYYISFKSSGPRHRTSHFEANFRYLKDALRYINGEDDGLLAKGTWLEQKSLMWPPEHHAPIYINYIHRPTPASSK